MSRQSVLHFRKFAEAKMSEFVRMQIGTRNSSSCMRIWSKLCVWVTTLRVSLLLSVMRQLPWRQTWLCCASLDRANGVQTCKYFSDLHYLFIHDSPIIVQQTSNILTQNYFIHTYIYIAFAISFIIIFVLLESDLLKKFSPHDKKCIFAL